MSIEVHPVPPALTIAELGSHSLFADCPRCRRSTQMIKAYLERHHAPETRLADIVARMYCGRCSKPGRRIWAIGSLHAPPRSGAEGRG